jgi:hypothetical protein
MFGERHAERVTLRGVRGGVLAQRRDDRPLNLAEALAHGQHLRTLLLQRQGLDFG